MVNLDYFFENDTEQNKGDIIPKINNNEDDWNWIKENNSHVNGNIVFYYYPSNLHIHNRINFKEKTIITYTDDKKDTIVNSENFYKHLKNAIKNIENENVPTNKSKYISFIHRGDFFGNNKPKVIIYNFLTYIILYYNKEF